MRCTAAKVTPADEITVKNSQLTCQASQARCCPVMTPMTKIAMPATASTRLTDFQRGDSGFVMSCASACRLGRSVS